MDDDPLSLVHRAHDAIEDGDMDALRQLFDLGLDPDAELPGDTSTLLHHALDVESDAHAQTGEPLTATATAYLLARGADPLRRLSSDGRLTVSAYHVAFVGGHWLAQELMEWSLRLQGRQVP